MVSSSAPPGGHSRLDDVELYTISDVKEDIKMVFRKIDLRLPKSDLPQAISTLERYLQALLKKKGSYKTPFS
jgi:hypothetical protein